MIDFEPLREILLTAARQAFSQMQQDHPEETFYAFGFFHEPLWMSIVPTANSEEALLRCAQEYKRDKWNLGYAQKSIADLKQELRWSSGDWEYLHDFVDTFDAVNKWLTLHEVREQCTSNDKTAWEHIHIAMRQSCRDVLLTLDKEGLFTVKQDRQNVVLNVMMGDQDRSWLEHARLLNPPDVYQRWLRELKQAGWHY